jgi:hypothetical protein
MKPALSRHILAKYSYTNFMKICPFGAKLFHAAGQTEMMKLIVTIHNFANVPKTHTEKKSGSKKRTCPEKIGHMIVHSL